ncbi:MAG: hypothetical protein IT340_20035 [Chloroflexi bacterium]|nr:hypothetical protein [Chloroflexota bacterium]
MARQQFNDFMARLRAKNPAVAAYADEMLATDPWFRRFMATSGYDAGDESGVAAEGALADRNPRVAQDAAAREARDPAFRRFLAAGNFADGSANTPAGRSRGAAGTASAASTSEAGERAKAGYRTAILTMDGNYLSPDKGPSPRYTKQGFGNWQDVVNFLMQGHDVRNLQTEGMRGAGRGFSYGGVTYDPTQQVGSGRKDRTPGSRFDGGAAWTGFVYRLNQLRAQRDRGGNAALGITATTSDDALARMAANWVNQTYRGTTGFTVR